MEDKKFIEADRRGGYCVLFLNTAALKLDNIKEIFAEFGEVREVRNLGAPKTFHFVTYKSYDDAQKAVDGLKDHPSIKLRYHTPGKKNNYKSPTESKNTTPDKVTKDKKFVKSHNFAPKRNHYDKENQNKNGNNKPVKKLEKVTVPGLVDARGRSMPMNYEPRNILPTIELVFANIHPTFDIYYLLYLLKPYDPIAISQIHPRQRYCLVYLKSTDLAGEVENAYDGKILAGRKLLALRTTKLLEEAQEF